MTSTDLIYVACFAVALFPLQTLIHEWSHTLVPRSLGANTWVRIFPGFVDGTWYWGISFWNNATLDDRQRGWTYAMPRVFNLAEALILTLVLLLVPMHHVLFAFVKAFQLVACVDFSYNTLRIFGNDSGSDAYGTADYLMPNVPIRLIQAVSALLLAGAAYLALLGIIW